MCPSDHPFAISQGKYCCEMPFKINDTNINSNCDGTHLDWKSPKVCCNASVPCLYPCEDQTSN